MNNIRKSMLEGKPLKECAGCYKVEKNGIQTRPIFSGNILRQPIMKKRNYKKHKQAHRVSDDVMKNGLLIGCHHGLIKKDLNYMVKTFKKFLIHHID